HCCAAPDLHTPSLHALFRSMVLHSMTSVPEAMCSSKAESPRYRPSTCLLAGSMVTTASTPLTAAGADSAAVAPASVAILSADARSEEHTSELQSRENLVCRL